MSPAHPKILGTQIGPWPDENACARSAQSLARALPLERLGTAPFIVELEGPLGAGKTSFARHLLRALGVLGRVKSPTYALVESYRLTVTAPAQGADRAPTLTLDIAHFDFYRLREAQEWEEAGLRELFAAPGLKLVEWAEQARALLPTPDLRLILEPQPSTAALSAAPDGRAAPTQPLNGPGPEAPQMPDSDGASQHRQVCIQAFSPAGLSTLAAGFAVEPAPAA